MEHKIVDGRVLTLTLIVWVFNSLWMHRSLGWWLLFVSGQETRVPAWLSSIFGAFGWVSVFFNLLTELLRA